MSAIEVTIAALRTSEELRGFVGTKIFNMMSTKNDLPDIIVYLVSEQPTDMLDGPSRWYRARVTVDCRSSHPPEVHDIAEAVKNVLEPIHRQPFAGCLVTFWKEGTDVTEFREESSGSARSLDFYVDWRKA